VAVITISRQFGAGGITVGKLIAEKLVYDFYYNEIIEMIASRSKVSAEGIKALEKTTGGRLKDLISGIMPKSLVGSIFDTDKQYMDKDTYIDSLYNIMATIAAEGNAVIVGRGSQHILKEHKNTFHVLILADLADRVKFMQQHYALSPDKAREAVNREDKRRRNLLRLLGLENYDQPDIYHLVLNISRINLDMACDLVCELPAQ